MFDWLRFGVKGVIAGDRSKQSLSSYKHSISMSLKDSQRAEHVPHSGSSGRLVEMLQPSDMLELRQYRVVLYSDNLTSYDLEAFAQGVEEYFGVART